MTRYQIRQILKRLLEQYPPPQFRQMQTNREVKLYLDTLVCEVMASIEDSRQRILDSHLPQLPLERAQYLGYHFRAVAKAELQNAMTKIRGRPAAAEAVETSEEQKDPRYLDIPHPMYICFADDHNPNTEEFRNWMRKVSDQDATNWLLREIKMSYRPKKPERRFIITSFITKVLKHSVLKIRVIFSN
ncbi:UNVERIFIED_ORG: hypothetical protein J2Y78_004154 [Buttiauxella agrestis ATCC 33320]